MVLRRWEIETEIYFIKRVDKSRMATAFQIFHGGHSTFINSFDKINFCLKKSTRARACYVGLPLLGIPRYKMGTVCFSSYPQIVTFVIIGFFL